MSSWNSPASTGRTARKRRPKRPLAMQSASSTRPKTKSAAASVGCDPVSRGGAVALGRQALALDGIGADLLGDDAAERRPLALWQVLVRVPQIGADQGLAAV